MSRFQHAWDKWQRADAHFGDLIKACDRFVEARPYLFVEKQDPHTGQWSTWSQINKDPSAIDGTLRSIAAIGGDAIHNVRASLDYVVHQLVAERVKARIIEAPDRPKDIGFPANDHGKDLHGTIIRKAALAGQQTVDLLHDIDPCQGGKGHRIWQLDTLNNIDKHRLLLATVGALDAMNSTFKVTPETVESFRRDGFNEAALTLIKNMHGKRSRLPFPLIPLKDNATVWGLYPNPLGEDLNTHFSSDVALNGAVVRLGQFAQSFVVVVKDFLGITHAIIAEFERLPSPVP